jgi:hypothetical protein
MAQLAVDYGTDKVRLLEFDGSGKRLRVLQVVEAELNGAVSETDEEDAALERDDLAAEAIANAMDEARLASDPSGMAWAAGQALSREFSLPFAGDEQIEKVVRFEAESHIPLDIDDVVIQHLVLRKSRDKSHILAVAVKKDDLLDRFDVLEEASIDPMFVDVDVFSLLHALKGTGVASEHERALVILAQDHVTSLLFMVDGELFAVRSLRMGTHGIPRSGTGDTGVTDEIAQARGAEYLGRMERELRRTLTTLPGLGELQAVHLLGSGSAIPDFDTTMQKVFASAAVAPLDLLDKVDHKLSDEEVARYGPDVGVALGVAYKLAGMDVTGTDFRRDECAYTRKFDQVKSPLIVLSFVVFLIVALKGIDTFYQWKKVRAEYGALLVDAREQLNMLVGDNAEAKRVWEDKEFGPRQVQAIAAAFDAKQNDLSLQLGRSSRIPPQPSALAVWMELSTLLIEHEKDIGPLTMRKLDIDVGSKQPIVRFSGEIGGTTEYNDLVDIIEADLLFHDLQMGDVDPPAKTGDPFMFSETTYLVNTDELQLRREG